MQGPKSQDIVICADNSNNNDEDDTTDAIFNINKATYRYVATVSIDYTLRCRYRIRFIILRACRARGMTNHHIPLNIVGDVPPVNMSPRTIFTREFRPPLGSFGPPGTLFTDEQCLPLSEYSPLS